MISFAYTMTHCGVIKEKPVTGPGVAVTLTTTVAVDTRAGTKDRPLESGQLLLALDLK